MSASTVYLIVGAISAVFTIGAYGFARDSWRRSTSVARRAGLVFGITGACLIIIGFVIRGEVIAVIAAPPGLLLWCGLAMRLTSWLGRRRNAGATP